MLEYSLPIDIILNALQDKVHIDLPGGRCVKACRRKIKMDYDYYEDVKNIVMEIRNELTLDESIQKLNSYIQWLLLEVRK
jgi:hypothetical protein